MRSHVAAVIATAALMLASPAGASPTGDIIEEALYSGDFAGGLDKLAPLFEAGDSEAQFGMGLIYFVEGIQNFAQALYRYGLAAPETGPMGPPLMVPVPINPNPEPLDYFGVRNILEPLVFSMEAASLNFEEAGQSGDYVVMLDPLKFRIDANADGTTEETETIGQVFTRAFGMTRPTTIVSPDDPPPVDTPPTDAASDSGRNGRTQKPVANDAAVGAPAPAASSESETLIGFDRADAIWLAGYSQVFAAQADFFLAHDFEDFVNSSFHRLFPHAKLPMQDYATGGMLMLDPSTDTAIADVIAAIHTINWPVIEPDRLKRVLERFLKITALSRANWEAILAETDDNRELVPSPRQTSLIPDAAVTDEVVEAWLETLDTADQVLAGDLLVPHWRFSQGFDLKAYFETATRFDLVMLMTGYDALPFIKEGPIATAESFAAANRVFGDDFLGYVFWFN